MKKNDMTQFLVWMRNGICFCVTWFLLLIVVTNYIFAVEFVATKTLAKMFLIVGGGVLIFCVFFTRLFVERWRFVTRLTGFMVSLAVYECLGFYWIGLFKGRGNVAQWFVFAAIILVLYFICIGIYERYSKKRGELYTQALSRYQQKQGK